MPVHIVFEKSGGEIVKGLTDCTVPSPTTKQLIDTDLSHGSISPGGETTPQIVHISTFSWVTNGDPSNAITDCGLFLTEYYESDPTYSPDSGKTFCGGSGSATFGNYTDAGGSHTASADLSELQILGDEGTGGVKVSLDQGRTYTTFTSSVGTLGSPISLAATSLDVGTVDGQLNPGDRSTIFLKIGIPTTYNSAAKAGVYLFNVGLFYNYTE